MMSRAARLASLCMVAFAVVTTAACFSLNPPSGVQVTCSAENRWCPGELRCCNDERCLPEGECAAPACPDGQEPCAIDDAIDCARALKCNGGCWQDFPQYQLVCDDPLFVPCSLDGFSERWFCQQDRSCVVWMTSGASALEYRGGCYQPPAQCAGGERHNCSCLTAPFSTSPPCAPYEMCDDGFTGCVACRSDFGLDAEADAANVRGDAGTWIIGDAIAPECFASAGESSSGASCCALSSAPATWDEDSYYCESGDFATSCEGYGADCMNDALLACSSDDPCLWSWHGSAGLHCATEGPVSPCVEGAWQCVTGSSPRSWCDCVAPGCPD